MIRCIILFDVLKEIASYGYEHDGKKTIYIYPEMNHTDKDFGFVMKIRFIRWWNLWVP